MNTSHHVASLMGDEGCTTLQDSKQPVNLKSHERKQFLKIQNTRRFDKYLNQFGVRGLDAGTQKEIQRPIAKGS